MTDIKKSYHIQKYEVLSLKMPDNKPEDWGKERKPPKCPIRINLIRCMACGSRKKEEDIHSERSRICIECVNKQNKKLEF